MFKGDIIMTRKRKQMIPSRRCFTAMTSSAGRMNLAGMWLWMLLFYMVACVANNSELTKNGCHSSACKGFRSNFHSSRIHSSLKFRSGIHSRPKGLVNERYKLNTDKKLMTSSIKMQNIQGAITSVTSGVSAYHSNSYYANKEISPKCKNSKKHRNTKAKRDTKTIPRQLNVYVEETVPSFSCKNKCDSDQDMPCRCDSICFVYHKCCEDMSLHCPDLASKAQAVWGSLLQANIVCTEGNTFMVASCPKTDALLHNDNAVMIDDLNSSMTIKGFDKIQLNGNFSEIGSTFKMPENDISFPSGQNNESKIDTLYRLLMESIPVVDTLTKIVYVNRTVYSCNARLGSSPIPWSLEIGIRSDDSQNRKDIDDVLTNVDFSKAHFFPDVSLPKWTMGVSCIHNSISTCDEKWDNISISAKEKCPAFVSYIKVPSLSSIRPFNNVYCALCNIGPSSRSGIAILNRVTVRFKARFSVIMKMSVDGLQVAAGSGTSFPWKNGVCPIGEGKKHQKCSLGSCSDHHKMINGECKINNQLLVVNIYEKKPLIFRSVEPLLKTIACAIDTSLKKYKAQDAEISNLRIVVPPLINLEDSNDWVFSSLIFNMSFPEKVQVSKPEYAVHRLIASAINYFNVFNFRNTEEVQLSKTGGTTRSPLNVLTTLILSSRGYKQNLTTDFHLTTSSVFDSNQGSLPEMAAIEEAEGQEEIEKLDDILRFSVCSAFAESIGQSCVDHSAQIYRYLYMNLSFFPETCQKFAAHVRVGINCCTQNGTREKTHIFIFLLLLLTLVMLLKGQSSY